MKKYCRNTLFCCFLLAFHLISFGQELNANVQIISPRLTNGDPNILKNLKTNIANYLNNTQWTNEMWKPEERIQCTFVINISAWDGGSNYQASAQVLSKRPVYGSAYTATLLNINDSYFNFTYTDGQTMNFSLQNTNGEDITNLLGFYAYLILGIDRDSFTEKGGDVFYNKSISLLNNAQASGGDGWKSSVTRNRYWLAYNLTGPDMEEFRKYIYFYHRNGLDLMSDDFPKGQKNVIKSFELLKNINIQRNTAVFFNSYCSAKAKEIAECLANADENDKANAYAILTNVDPANIVSYDQIKRSSGSAFVQKNINNNNKPAQQGSFEKPEIPRF